MNSFLNIFGKCLNEEDNDGYSLNSSIAQPIKIDTVQYEGGDKEEKSNNQKSKSNNSTFNNNLNQMSFKPNDNKQQFNMLPKNNMRAISENTRQVTFAADEETKEEEHK